MQRGSVVVARGWTIRFRGRCRGAVWRVRVVTSTPRVEPIEVSRPLVVVPSRQHTQRAKAVCQILLQYEIVVQVLEPGPLGEGVVLQDVDRSFLIQEWCQQLLDQWVIASVLARPSNHVLERDPVGCRIERVGSWELPQRRRVDVAVEILEEPLKLALVPLRGPRCHDPQRVECHEGKRHDEHCEGHQLPPSPGYDAIQLMEPPDAAEDEPGKEGYVDVVRGEFVQ